MRFTTATRTSRGLLPMLALSTLLAPHSALAHLGYVFEANLKATVNIDGVLSPGEWADAASTSFLFCERASPGRMFVKNDATYLYVAVEIQNARWRFQGPPGSGNDFLNVHFDNGHDGSFTVGDNTWNVRGGDGLIVDGYVPGIPTSVNSPDPTSTDFTAAVTHTNPVWDGVGTYTIEYKGTLDSADDLHDFSLAIGQTVGVNFTFASSGCPGNKVWPSGAASQFADIVIAVPDEDGDGVLDNIDQCHGTTVGEAVDDKGCAIAQLCPCERDWANHGEYVSCVTRMTQQFRKQGVISPGETEAVVSRAAGSKCGSR